MNQDKQNKIRTLAHYIEDAVTSAIGICDDYDIKKDLRLIEDCVLDIIEEVKQ